jgi:hypothetical protein
MERIPLPENCPLSMKPTVVVHWFMVAKPVRVVIVRGPRVIVGNCPVKVPMHSLASPEAVVVMPLTPEADTGVVPISPVKDAFEVVAVVTVTFEPSGAV